MKTNDQKWAMVSSTMSAILTRQQEINELIELMIAFLMDEEKDDAKEKTD